MDLDNLYHTQKDKVTVIAIVDNAVLSKLENLSAMYLQFAILKCTASIFYPDWCNLYYVRNCNNGKLSLTASNKYSKFIPSVCTLQNYS